jgi:methylated-DNA-[protein]-cysteine S-methyltransferase
MHETIFQTDWGWVGVAASGRGVRAIVLPKPSRRAVECDLQNAGTVDGTSSNGTGKAAVLHLKAARVFIEAYLDGRARPFNLPLDLEGQPRFRRKVWEVLQTIPYGRVRSYGWVARKIGKPKAARAVGGACGANPVPLLVPCHRVIAGDGSLGGFSGGLGVKKRLLRLEGTI